MTLQAKEPWVFSTRIQKSPSPLHRQGKKYLNPPATVIKPDASPRAHIFTPVKKAMEESYSDSPIISRKQRVLSSSPLPKESISRKKIVAPPKKSDDSITLRKIKTYSATPSRQLIERSHLRTYASPALSLDYDPVKGKGEISASPRRESVKILPKPSGNPLTSSTERYWEKPATSETPRHIGVRTFYGSGSPVRNPITGETRVLERPSSAFKPRAIAINPNLVRRNPITGE